MKKKNLSSKLSLDKKIITSLSTSLEKIRGGAATIGSACNPSGMTCGQSACGGCTGGDDTIKVTCHVTIISN
ncbi:MAG TPA: class I lanthipeptide [Chitinophaga sp.]|uniref:class I lanthipeptide n=1 Tax=Chitinophaga sp. TaxID=1869181 RepID=UPI002D199F47|nr:class I lanthipeptide [Chitinophaga sp.]HVI47254.1 class I lanthipeptide [Chitinophaga sp.]